MDHWISLDWFCGKSRTKFIGFQPQAHQLLKTISPWADSGKNMLAGKKISYNSGLETKTPIKPGGI